MLKDHLDAALGRGVKVFLIGHGDVGLPGSVCIHHEMDETVLAERGREVFVVVDGREALVGRPPGSSRQGYGLRTAAW